MGIGTHFAAIVTLCAGILLCFAGLLWRPWTAYNLFRPRVVVPAMVFFSVFYQFIRYRWLGAHQGSDIPGVARYRREFSFDAVAYVTLCAGMFWVGYLVPFGRALGDWAAALAVRSPLSMQTLRNWAIGLSGLSLLLGLLFDGAGLFSGTWGAGYGAFAVTGIGSTVFRSYSLLGIAGALLLGYSWPGPEERSALWFPAAALLLFCDAAPWMAHFSRGSGLFPLLAVLGYFLRHRRVPWAVAAAGVVVFFLGVATAVTGRGVYGHNGGSLNYLAYLWPSLFHWSRMFSSTTSTADSFTPLTVVMAGLHHGNDMGRLTKLNWILTQLPLPHSLRPKWTFFPGIFIAHEWNANASVFGYNPGMFGDTFATFGYWGSLVFAFVGAAYRAVDAAAFGRQTPGASLLPLLAPVSYYALGQGCFTNFRAFNTALVVPAALILAVTYLRRDRFQVDPLVA